MVDFSRVNSILNTNMSYEEMKIFQIDFFDLNDENANYIKENFVQCANCHIWFRKVDIDNEHAGVCNPCYNEISQNSEELIFENMQWYIDHHKK